jgi:predicted amidophosphoribosyltransferase
MLQQGNQLQLDRRLRSFVDLVFPRVCVLCEAPIVEPQCEAICLQCLDKIQATENGCKRCGAPPATIGRESAAQESHVSAIAEAITVFEADFENLDGIRFEARVEGKSKSKNCRYCEKRTWSFRRAYCYTAYRGLAAKGVKKMKQTGNEPLTVQMGDRMSEWLATASSLQVAKFDALIPIPQHWLRRLMVRYNQAEVLAERVSQRLNIPLVRRVLHRTRWTEKQGIKTFEQRLTDVENSFACKKVSWLKDARVLLVDDVVTSGATASDAARALRDAGVARVEVVAFARAIGPADQKD